MRGNRRRIALGFTLLEAVIALTLLSSACVTCLTLRSQSIANRERIARQQQLDRDADAVFQMFVGGLLPAPERDPKTGAMSWKGEHLGREYTLTRQLVSMSNPLSGKLAYETLPSVTVWRYEITINKRTTHFYWHR